MTENALLVILFSAVGVLLVALALPLIRRRVPPNFLFGVRTTQTLADNTVWYEVNRLFGKDLLVVGIVIFGASVATGIFGSSINAQYLALILSGVLIISLLIALIRCVWNCRELGPN